MPAWWPTGERWPPRRLSPSGRGERALPARIAVLFAIGINLIGVGALVAVRAVASTVPWAYAWPMGAIAMVIVTGALFVLAMRGIGAPLAEMVAAAHRVGDGDLSVRLGEHGLPWFRSVARAFNTMAGRLEHQQRERGALMADIAHELRTPLSVIQGRVEGMLDGVYPRDEQHVALVLEETRTLSRLVEDLRRSAQAESGALRLQVEPVDLDAVVQDAAAAFQPHAEAREVRIQVEGAFNLPLLELDPHRIRQVLGNLLANALRHAPRGSTVTMACGPEADAVVLRVMDEGPGIPQENLARVFERFYRDPASPGSGLGLSIARNLITAHGGTIVASNREEGGATLTVRLPNRMDEVPPIRDEA